MDPPDSQLRHLGRSAPCARKRIPTTLQMAPRTLDALLRGKGSSTGHWSESSLTPLLSWRVLLCPVALNAGGNRVTIRRCGMRTNDCHCWGGRVGLAGDRWFGGVGTQSRYHRRRCGLYQGRGLGVSQAAFQAGIKPSRSGWRRALPAAHASARTNPAPQFAPGRLLAEHQDAGLVDASGQPHAKQHARHHQCQ